MSKPFAVVVGAGPGIGAAVCRVLCDEGYDVGLVARSQPRLDQLKAELETLGAQVETCAADVTHDVDFAAGLRALVEPRGRVDHLHFNPSATRMADPLALSSEDLLADVHLGVASLLTAVQAARPVMREGARITATGSISAEQPWVEAASLGVQKAGLRNLVDALDQRLSADGIRAVSVTVRGVIEPGGEFDPNRIAEAILTASRQPVTEWRSEVPYP